MADITPFNFGAHAVRVITHNSQPWFVASDVCQALGYSNTSKAIGDHLDADERYNEPLDRGGSLLVISESGLYALVLRSRKPEARKFAKWVTSEVLPSIRQTGSYGQPAFNPDQVALAHRAALVATAEIYQSVFDAVMQGQDWQHNRYMLSFNASAPEGPTVRAKAIERNACVLPITRFYAAVEDSITVDAQTLMQLVSTCTARLGHMAARNAAAAPVQGSLLR
ncbi:BRO-N domain-containing protein [Comamonas terrigena]|uniref:BRO-N domain-containing protein n=1 Tax=Comamonas terrigena TaxID=32013 RepID=UPI002449124B|nr:Bro-N domain-containing protein [Comamonas terrigena]MDH1700315.1 Bro-N domain-containing protein [Comamonas terrigena]